jgi:hypothetical protein
MYLPRYLLTATLVIALGSGAISLATGIWMLASNIPGFGGEEGNVVYTVQQFVAGDPIYTDPGRPPFTITQYSPLFYVVSGTLARCCSVSATDPASITMLCRLVSLTAAVGVALLVFGITARLRLPTAVGVLVAVFSFVSAVPWHFLARPDALMSFFLVLAVYLVMRIDPARPLLGHLCTAGAVLAAGLAVATKQNGVQAAGLVLLYLLLARAWKELITAFLTGGALVGLVLALAEPLQAWLGPAFRENLIDGVRNGVDLIAALERTFVPFFRQFAFLVALAVLATFGFFRTKADPAKRFLGLASLLLLVFACGTGLKTGSAVNYFIEFVIFASITAALYCQAALESAPATEAKEAVGRIGNPSRPFLPALVLASLVFFLPFGALDQFDRCCYAKAIPGTLRPQPRYQFQASGAVARFLRDHLDDHPDTFVLTRECFSVGNLLFPFTVVPQPRIAEISHAIGVVNYQEFRSCVANGRVGYLVTPAGTRPSRFLGTDFEDFRLVREVDGYAIYQYAPARQQARSGERR